MPSTKQACSKCKRHRVCFLIGPKAGLCKSECGKGSSTNDSSNYDIIDFSCNKCNRDINDDQKYMTRQYCKNPFHVETCCNVTFERYNIIEKEGLLNIFMWFCSNCNNRVIEALDKLNDLENRLAALETSSNMNETIDKKINEKVQEYLSEHFEIEKRKTKIIIHGIPEPKESITTVIDGSEVSRPTTLEERNAIDKSKLLEITRNVPEINFGDGAVLKCTRFGARKHNYKRPLGVELCNMSRKSSILSNAHKLRSVNDIEWITPVYINADLTPKQRVKYNEARDELKRRKAAGENNLVIRNFKVVTYTPRNQVNQIQGSSVSDSI